MAFVTGLVDKQQPLGASRILLQQRARPAVDNLNRAAATADFDRTKPYNFRGTSLPMFIVGLLSGSAILWARSFVVWGVGLLGYAACRVADKAEK